MISVIIPTYNERGNVPLLVSRLAAVLPEESEIIVVDDNSPDGTGAVVEKLSSRFPALRLVRRAGKQGLTSAIIAGVSAARGDRVVVMDADLSHPPEKVPMLAAALGRCDLAIGSRMLEGGGVKSWPFHRKLISQGAELLARLLLGVKVSDPMSGFFAARKAIFTRMRLRTSGYKILLNILADNPHILVAEIPYIFRDRTAGETKLGAAEVAAYLFDIVRIKFG